MGAVGDRQRLGRLPAGVILAGGRGLRMGGADKALLTLAGRPLLAHVLDRLAPQVGAIALSANGDPARFASFGLPVLADAGGSGEGPLAGLLAGLDWAAAIGAAHVVAVAVDTPFLPADLVARLAAAAGPGGAAVAASPDAAGRLRRHPAMGLWPVALRGALRAALDGGLRKAGLWAETAGARVAAFETGASDPFFNLNRPEDLAAAEARLAAGGPA